MPVRMLHHFYQCVTRGLHGHLEEEGVHILPESPLTVHVLIRVRISAGRKLKPLSKIVLTHLSDARVGLIDDENEGRKSCDTLSLTSSGGLEVRERGQ